MWRKYSRFTSLYSKCNLSLYMYLLGNIGFECFGCFSTALCCAGSGTLKPTPPFSHWHNMHFTMTLRWWRFNVTSSFLHWFLLIFASFLMALWPQAVSKHGAHSVVCIFLFCSYSSIFSKGVSFKVPCRCVVPLPYLINWLISQI